MDDEVAENKEREDIISGVSYSESAGVRGDGFVSEVARLGLLELDGRVGEASGVDEGKASSYVFGIWS